MAGMKHLFCFGFGFSARTLAGMLDPAEWRVSATSRSTEGLQLIRDANAVAYDFESGTDIPDDVTHVLSSVPPGAADPVIARYGTSLEKRSRQITWAGYLSTTGVYGNHEGAWTDENTPLTPNSERGAKRVAAEALWLDLWRENQMPVHVFRLAGIYGPGRNALMSMREGTAQRVIKPGQIFSRIHVHDIATVLLASIAHPNPGRAYNVADDEPCPPQDVVAHAAELLGMPAPPDVPFEQAKLSPMAMSFYADSKRVSNARAKQELGWELAYPTYREGLRALLG
jgi:dTDP-D-glucose 4,6-dehydratase